MMEVETLAAHRPLPYSKNPRKIPQSAIDKGMERSRRLQSSADHLVQEPTRPDLLGLHVELPIRLGQGGNRPSIASMATRARYGRCPTLRLRAASVQLRSRTNSLRYPWNCIPVPTISVTNRSAAAARNSSPPSKLGRRCYAIELEPAFVDVAVTRWERLTGLKAEVIADEGAEGTG